MMTINFTLPLLSWEWTGGCFLRMSSENLWITKNRWGILFKNTTSSYFFDYCRYFRGLILSTHYALSARSIIKTIISTFPPNSIGRKYLKAYTILILRIFAIFISIFGKEQKKGLIKKLRKEQHRRKKEGKDLLKWQFRKTNKSNNPF